MNVKDVGKVKIIKGTEEIILAVDPYGGYVSIEKSRLDAAFVSKIKSDAANKMGWKKYRKILKDQGFDVDEGS